MILAGGVGSRFWPASTPRRPKQLLPLAGERPLITETIDRVRRLIPLERIRVLAGEELVGPMIAAVPDLERDHFLVEPRARGTAPALVWAAHTIARRQSGDAVMVSLHADHVIRPESAFRESVAAAARAAERHDRLFTIGIQPSRPETGYGYIRRGEPLDGGASGVRAFVEKPDASTARDYVEAGGYLWNTGIFAWRVGLLLDEVRAHTPELAALLDRLDDDDVDAYFDASPTLSIDRGVLERSDRVGVVPATFEWDDVGTWDALGRTRDRDARGNVALGDAHLEDASDCVIWNETDEPVIAFGTRDLVVVRRPGVTLVLPRERASDLKELLEALPESVRERIR